jgi:hypothetical protein
MRLYALGTCIIGAVLSLCTPCRAESAPTVSSLKSTIEDGWTLHPAMEASSLVGYLAQQVAGAAAPNGYTVVWFERQPDDSFSMKGYDGLSLVAAAQKVEVGLGKTGLFIYAEFANELYGGGGGGDAEPSATFTNMSSGLAVTDPLAPIANQLPPELMELVVQAGAQGATGLSVSAVDNTNACNPKYKLDDTLKALIPQVEGIVASDGEDAPSPSVNAIFGCCWPTTTVTTFSTPAGPWRSTNPTGTVCNYSRPTTIWTITCSISITCVTTCTSVVSGTGTQTGSCPGNPSGNCPVTPPAGCP